MDRKADYIAIGILTAVLLLSLILAHEAGTESSSIRPVIQSMVEEEFRLRYRAVPVIHGKYVSVINGADVLVEGE